MLVDILLGERDQPQAAPTASITGFGELLDLYPLDTWDRLQQPADAVGRAGDAVMFV
jgi:hypothetical protein